MVIALLLQTPKDNAATHRILDQLQVAGSRNRNKDTTTCRPTHLPYQTPELQELERGQGAAHGLATHPWHEDGVQGLRASLLVDLRREIDALTHATAKALEIGHDSCELAADIIPRCLEDWANAGPHAVVHMQTQYAIALSRLVVQSFARKLPPY